MKKTYTAPHTETLDFTDTSEALMQSSFYILDEEADPDKPVLVRRKFNYDVMDENSTIEY